MLFSKFQETERRKEKGRNKNDDSSAKEGLENGRVELTESLARP